jgi:hypothetical protein
MSTCTLSGERTGLWIVRSSKISPEAAMEILEKGHLTPSAPEAGALLYVTDCVSDSQESLEYACKLAEKHGVHVELLHVIDPERTPSSPDAHIGAQYSIEAFARSLRTIKSNARALLLFGRAEDVIAKRAAAIKATLVAFQLDGSTRDSSKTTLAHRLNKRCACPVLTFSRFPGAAMQIVDQR